MRYPVTMIVGQQSVAFAARAVAGFANFVPRHIEEARAAAEKPLTDIRATISGLHSYSLNPVSKGFLRNIPTGIWLSLFHTTYIAPPRRVDEVAFVPDSVKESGTKLGLEATPIEIQSYLGSVVDELQSVALFVEGALQKRGEDLTPQERGALQMLDHLPSSLFIPASKTTLRSHQEVARLNEAALANLLRLVDPPPLGEESEWRVFIDAETSLYGTKIQAISMWRDRAKQMAECGNHSLSRFFFSFSAISALACVQSAITSTREDQASFIADFATQARDSALRSGDHFTAALAALLAGSAYMKNASSEASEESWLVASELYGTAAQLLEPYSPNLELEARIAAANASSAYADRISSAVPELAHALRSRAEKHMERVQLLMAQEGERQRRNLAVAALTGGGLLFGGMDLGDTKKGKGSSGLPEA